MLLNKVALNKFVLFFCLLIFSTYSFSNGIADYEKARQAYNSNQYQEAFIHVRNALKAQPDYLPAKILVGQLFLINGLYQEAEVEFADAYTAGADVNLIIEDWGRALLLAGQFDKIIEFEDLETLAQDRSLVWLKLRAQACLGIKDVPCAKKAYESILNTSAEHPDGLNGLAILSIRDENPAQALLYLDRALKKDNNNAQAWGLKGQITKNDGDIQQALVYLNKAFVLDPTDPFISKNLVDAYISATDYDTAIKISEDILSQTPDDLYVMFANSWLTSQVNSLNAAKSQLELIANRLANVSDHALSAEPSLYYLRGMVGFMQQNFERAREDFLAYSKETADDLQTAILLAKTYMALNDSDSAMEVLELHEQALMDIVHHGLLLGNLYLKRNRLFKAFPLLNKLAEKYPQHIDVQIFAIRVALARGKSAEGFTGLEQLLARYPEDRKVLTSHGLINLQAGRLTQAQISIERLYKLHSDEPSIINMKAALLIVLGEFEQAKDILDKVLASSPDLFAAKYNQATILFHEARYAEAKALISALLRRQPGHIQASLLEAKVVLASGEYDQAIEKYRQLLRQYGNSVAVIRAAMSAYLSQNDYQLALRLLRQLSKLDPENPDYPIQMARIYIKTREFKRAGYELEGLDELAQGNASALAAQSQLWLALNNAEKALASIYAAHQVDPQDIGLHLQWVKLLTTAGQFEQADAQLRLLNRKLPENPHVLFKKAELAQAMQQQPNAFELYLQVLAIDTSFDLAYAKLYAISANLGDFDQLISLLEQEVEKSPNRYFPRSLLAQYHYYYGDRQLAKFHYEFILEADSAPNRYALLNRLAVMYLRTDLAKSTAYSEQAYKLNSSDAKVAHTYGWILALKGKYEESLPILRAASVRDTLNPQLKYHLAFTLHALNRSSAAKRLLEEALASEDRFEGRDDASALLDKIVSNPPAKAVGSSS